MISFKSQRGKALPSCSLFCIYEVFQILIFRSRKEVAASPPPPRQQEQQTRPQSRRELPRSCLRTNMPVDALDGKVDDDDAKFDDDVKMMMFTDLRTGCPHLPLLAQPARCP